jgi:hypothetical protein
LDAGSYCGSRTFTAGKPIGFADAIAERKRRYRAEAYEQAEHLAVFLAHIEATLAQEYMATLPDAGQDSHAHPNM